MSFGNITDVPGIKVGHKEDLEALTGCTVILTEEGATAGVDVRGSAPGTRETDLLDPINTVDQVHAICLSGGSAFGLEAASGVMDYLEEKGIGMDVGVAKVPIVPSAILFDLAVGDSSVRPDKLMGYEAAKNAIAGPITMGNVGAGTGATVGKILGFNLSTKSGLGSASIKLQNGLIVGAIVAVNAVGDIRDPHSGEIIAGARDPETGTYINSEQFLRNHAEMLAQQGTNTTIGVVAVNANLTKAEAKKVAQVSQNAIARTTFPAHTSMDGDTIFTVANGDKNFPLDLITSVATEVMEKAIINAVKEAKSTHGISAWNE
ncbi:P1 family peptidase [Bacillaceae bacterium W0354]